LNEREDQPLPGTETAQNIFFHTFCFNFDTSAVNVLLLFSSSLTRWQNKLECFQMHKNQPVLVFVGETKLTLNVENLMGGLDFFLTRKYPVNTIANAC